MKCVTLKIKWEFLFKIWGDGMVYAVIYTIGYSCGKTELVSICTSKEKAEKIIKMDIMNSHNIRNENNYSIKRFMTDTLLNEIVYDWYM